MRINKTWWPDQSETLWKGFLKGFKFGISLWVWPFRLLGRLFK